MTLHAITLEAGVLARAMKSAASIVASAQTLPILANVRLIADGEVLEIATSDLDTEYRQRLPLAASGAVATTVEARRLAAVAGAAADGAQIELAAEDGRVTIKAGRARWVLPAMPAADFPPMPVDDLCPPLQIAGKLLAETIGRTLWAAGTEITQHWLCGLYLHAEEAAAGKARKRQVRVSGYDTRVFAMIDLPLAWPARDGEPAPDVIVPAKYARTLAALAAEVETVWLAWDARKIRAEIGDITLTGKLVEGQYPDYRTNLATLRAAADAAPCHTVEPPALRAALRRVDLVSAEKARALRIVPRAGVIELGMAGLDGRLATEEIPAEAAEAEPTEIDIRQMAGMVEAVGGDTIALRQVSRNMPLFVARTVADGFFGMISPLRT